MLAVNELHAGYGAIKILRGVSLEIGTGEIVCLLGSNGAGKTTLVRTISGLADLHSGTIMWNNNNISGLPPHDVTRFGIGHVLEGRLLFSSLTVYDNLMVGAAVQSNHSEIAERLKSVFAMFPRLQERRNQIASTLSGGEQQMVAIARALMSHPKLLILDEPSLGLAPHLVQEVFEVVVRLCKELGTSVLLVEQNAELALRNSDRAYVIDQGTIVMSGDSAKLAEDPDVQRAYLGVS